MTSNKKRRQPNSPKTRGAVDVQDIPEISEATRRTFEAISDPKNAHLFTVEAARKAFAHIKV